MSGAVVALTAEWLEDAIHGRVKTRRPMRLRADELTAYYEAVICGWVEVRATKRDNLENAYWAYCEMHGQPFVRVRPRRRYASVSFDFIATRKNLTEAGRDGVGNVLRMGLALTKGSQSTPSAMWGGTSGYLSHVAVEEAGRVAAQVWACITAPGHWEYRT